MSIIQGTSKAAAGGYTIDQSIRFNDDDNAYLTFTPSAGDSNTTWTFSCWYKQGNPGATVDALFSAGANGNNFTVIRLFQNTHEIVYDHYDAGVVTDQVKTNAVFRDPSAWYHFVVAVDTTQGTAADRVKIYVNGSQITSFATANYPSLNQATDVGTAVEHQIGRLSGGGYALDGYLAEINFVDGQQLAPTDLGKFDSTTGQWVPIEFTGSYGTNGFYITGEDSADLGADYSGNGNDFTSSGLTSADQVLDSPTNNYATLNPLDFVNGGGTTADGNLLFVDDSSGSYPGMPSTIWLRSGKWQFECTLQGDSLGNEPHVGIINENTDRSVRFRGDAGATTVPFIWNCYTNVVWQDGSSSTPSGLSATTTTSRITLLLDADAAKIYLVVDGTEPSGQDAEAGTGGYSISGTEWAFCIGEGAGANGMAAEFGAIGFVDSFPSFDSVTTNNLPDPTIADPTAHFQTTLYTGNSSDGHEINQSGNSTFEPGLVWIKDRLAANQHHLFDQVRGVNKRILSSSNAAESTQTDQLVSFDSDGFTLDDDLTVQAVNRGSNYVAWQWKANGSGSSNSDGSITSTISSNTTAGFSTVTYTGTGANATVGHGLGVTPSMIIVKNRSTAATDWPVYHASNTAAPETDVLFLNTTASTADDATYWNDTAPTSSVFTVGTNNEVNKSSDSMVAYVYAEVEGFSKIGSYTGNGSSDGPFIYCGFRPALVIIKRATGAATKWVMLDSTRDTYNVTDAFLHPNESTAENEGSDVDFLSNGFKARFNDSWFNASGSTYIFMAFAEFPFQYANAR